ncbi:MAG: YWFCY domain-containing protein [Chitinophagaceae bacterium]
MAMHTGENEQGLKKVIDMTRMIAIVVLIHCYYNCYDAFKHWQLTSNISDDLLRNISRTGLLTGFLKTKLIALSFLLVSLLGVKGRKSETLNYRIAFVYLVTGLIIYFISGLVLISSDLDSEIMAVSYMFLTGIGFILVITGGGLITRIIKSKLNPNVFNKENETFPQEERLLKNEFSINLPARYNLKGKMRKSWINFINPMRGLLVIGSPGSGKSYFVVEHVIKQHIKKGFYMSIYDYKYDDLTKLAYNHYLLHLKNYAIPPAFYVINFDDNKRVYNQHTVIR